MIKLLLINGLNILKGSLRDSSPFVPSVGSGFGRVNMESVITNVHGEPEQVFCEGELNQGDRPWIKEVGVKPDRKSVV